MGVEQAPRGRWARGGDRTRGSGPPRPTVARVPAEPAPPILSFRPRRGRVTAGQQRALDGLWGDYGLDWAPGDRVDASAVFGRRAPLVLEIGFGMGEATAAMAQADPARDIVAVDVHTPGVGALLARLHEGRLRNVRVATADGVELLRDGFGPGSLDEVRVFFPDPWPKARHHKRRLVAGPFVALVAERLAPGGRLHCATDWADYARQMLDVVAADGRFRLPPAGLVPRPTDRPLTRFERQGLGLGHDIADLVAVRR